jgi:hypothetical protein
VNDQQVTVFPDHGVNSLSAHLNIGIPNWNRGNENNLTKQVILLFCLPTVRQVSSRLLIRSLCQAWCSSFYSRAQPSFSLPSAQDRQKALFSLFAEPAASHQRPLDRPAV